MKKLVLCSILLLGGCASIDRPQMHVMQHAKVVAPAPVAPPVATPNAQVKKRWYSHFPHHPKLFHQ